MSDGYVSLKEFTVSLHDLCKAKKSKMVFFTSDLNRAGRIVVDNGNIVSMRFFNKSGQQALNAMLDIGRLKFRVDDTAPGIMSELDTPASQDIFSQLLSAGQNVSSIDESTQSQLTEEMKKDIEKKLVNIIGPMGSLLCKDVLQTATSVNQIIDEMSKHLSIEDMETFKDNLTIIS